MLTTRLEHDARAKLLAHLLALPSENRRMRFGGTMHDTAVDGYVERLDFDRDVLYGVYDGDLDLAGVAHVSLAEVVAEFGVSVLPGNRRRGIGTALISRAALHARNQGIPLLFMQCLRENHAIIRIARALGMRVVAHGPECEASLPLRRGNPATFARELWQDGIALCDDSLRAHFLSPSKIRLSSSLHAARDAEDAKAA